MILAAWLYFMVVFGILAAGQHDRVCWVALVVAMGARAPTCCLAAWPARPSLPGCCSALLLSRNWRWQFVWCGTT